MSAVRCLALVLPALALAVPVAAQFKVPKKVREMTGVEKAKPAPADAGDGGTLVLDDELIDRLILGLRARDARKKAAMKEDTPYGRYHRQRAAYVAAQAKCEAAKQSYTNLAMSNPDLAQRNAERNGVFLEKMIAAQQKGDTAAQRVWGDSMAAIFDPACTVKEPQQPNNMYDMQRAVDSTAEEASLEESGLDRREMGAAVDRAIAIMEDQPPPDASPSEQKAVDKREQELRELTGRTPPPEARTPKPAPAPAPAPAATVPQPSAAQQAAADCMVRNAQKHEKELERMGKAAAAAGEANDMATALAYADSINRLQNEGCR